MIVMGNIVIYDFGLVWMSPGKLQPLTRIEWRAPRNQRPETGDIKILNFIINVLATSWHLLLDASIYILFGLIVSGLLRVFLNPNTVVKHLGRGRFASVFKAAFLGIPIPL
jgi:hypothetical protein